MRADKGDCRERKPPHRSPSARFCTLPVSPAPLLLLRLVLRKDFDDYNVNEQVSNTSRYSNSVHRPQREWNYFVTLLPDYT